MSSMQHVHHINCLAPPKDYLFTPCDYENNRALAKILVPEGVTKIVCGVYADKNCNILQAYSYHYPLNFAKFNIDSRLIKS